MMLRIKYTKNTNVFSKAQMKQRMQACRKGCAASMDHSILIQLFHTSTRISGENYAHKHIPNNTVCLILLSISF